LLQAQATLDAARCSRPTLLGRARGEAATNPAEDLATKRHKESQKEIVAGKFNHDPKSSSCPRITPINANKIRTLKQTGLHPRGELSIFHKLLAFAFFA
jgi:hypothetical protein